MSYSRTSITERYSLLNSDITEFFCVVLFFAILTGVCIFISALGSYVPVSVTIVTLSRVFLFAAWFCILSLRRICLYLVDNLGRRGLGAYLFRFLLHFSSSKACSVFVARCVLDALIPISDIRL